MIVSYKNSTVECKVVNDISSGLLVEIIKPELISGLVLSVENGISKIKYGNVSYELDYEKMLQTDFITYLSGALSDVVNTTTYMKLDNSYWKFTGKINSYEYIFLQDSATGFPVSIRIPKVDLTIKFSNMKSLS